MRKTVIAAALVLVAPAAWAQTVTVEHPWARATAPAAEAGAAYGTLTVTGGTDRLTGASSPVAAQVAVHENVHDAGVMRMRPVEGGIALEPGKPLTLAPGGYHLMLEGLRQPLKPGETFPMTLTFAKAPPVTVTVPVAAAGASAAPEAHTH
jgi:copper(I)-binding protein